MNKYALILFVSLLFHSSLAFRRLGGRYSLAASRKREKDLAESVPQLRRRARENSSKGGKGGKGSSTHSAAVLSPGTFGEDELDANILETEGTMTDEPCDDRSTAGNTLDNGAAVDDLDGGTVGDGAVDGTVPPAGGDDATDSTAVDETVDDAGEGPGKGKDHHVELVNGDGTSGDTGEATGETVADDTDHTGDSKTGENGSTNDGSPGGDDTGDSNTGENGSTNDGSPGGDNTDTGDSNTGENGSTNDGSPGGDDTGDSNTEEKGSTNDGSPGGDNTDASDSNTGENGSTNGGSPAADDTDTDTGDSNTGEYESTTDASPGGDVGDSNTEEATGVVFGDEGTDSLNPSPGDDPSIRLAQCAVNDPAYESIEDKDLISKVIEYEYEVSTTTGDVGLTEILKFVEFLILKALGASGKVMSCSSQRRRRRLEAGPITLRIESDPVDSPKQSCMDKCENIEIQGGVTASVPDGAYLVADIDTQLQCDILPVVTEVLRNLGSENIPGLEKVRVLTEPPSNCITEVSTSSPPGAVQTTASESTSQVSAGVMVGAALGAMCLVLLGLLVVRQKIVKKRKESNGSVATKETKPINTSATEMTMDANETQITHLYLSPKATQSSDDSSTILGISASPDDCSVWGDAKGPSKIEEVESPHKADPEPSDITYGDEWMASGSTRNVAFISPPEKGSSLDQEDQNVPFEPKIHEEESLMYIELSEDQDSVLFEPKIHEEESLMHIPLSEDQDSVPFEPKIHEEETLMHIPLSEDQDSVLFEPKIHEEESLMHIPLSEDQDSVPFEPKIHEEESLMHIPLSEDQDSVPFEPKIHEEESLMHIPLSEDQDRVPFEPKIHEEESLMHIPLSEDQDREEESLIHDTDLMKNGLA